MIDPESTKDQQDEPDQHRAVIEVEWTPSASIGEPEAVAKLVERVSDRLMDELLSMGVVDPYVGATLPAPLVFGVSDTPEPPPDRYEAYAMDCEGYGYTPPSAVPATPEGGELEDLLANLDEAAEREPGGLHEEAASALRRQRDEIDVLQDDVLRFITQRNLVCERLAARIIPGPDGQDDIDRRCLIREVSEDAWDDVDGWQEMAAKGAMVVAERDRLERELAEARDTRPAPTREQVREAIVAGFKAAEVPQQNVFDCATDRILALLSGVPTEDRS